MLGILVERCAIELVKNASLPDNVANLTMVFSLNVFCVLGIRRPNFEVLNVNATH